ncbi:MAG: HAD-IA family hydrolase [Caldithrix sp.]|nr:HAD-IA family hydrolase [Caldithrix sp.]
MKSINHLQLHHLQAVIFDMDGVLVDTEPIHLQAFEHFLQEKKVTFNAQDLHALIGYSVRDNMETINRTYLKDRPIDVDEGVRQRNAIYMDLIHNEQLKPISGIIDIIDLCINHNVITALASSSTRKQIEAILDNLQNHPDYDLQLRSVFKTTVSGDDVKHKKPAPDIYQKTVTQLGIKPSHCLAIEDSQAGVLSAKAAGLYCIGINNLYNNHQKLQTADAVVDSPPEIVQWMFDNEPWRP